jgi:6-phosphogluconate dehydrogenase (decarboxylating)
MQLVRRLLRDGHEAVVFDQNPEAVAALVAEGAVGADSLADFVAKLSLPRAAWVMLPAGAITEATVKSLGGLMAPDDVVIDGGNSFYKDDIRRAAELNGAGIHYVDVGTSGDLSDPGAGRGHHPEDARARGPRPAGGGRLHPCRPERGGPLRQDGP